MMLTCPFCHASEEERVSAVDGEGKKVILVIFDCPFHFTFESAQFGSEEGMQGFLEDWKKGNGNEWLDSIGPVLKARELSNIKRYESSQIAG